MVARFILVRQGSVHLAPVNHGVHSVNRPPSALAQEDVVESVDERGVLLDAGVVGEVGLAACEGVGGVDAGADVGRESETVFGRRNEGGVLERGKGERGERRGVREGTIGERREQKREALKERLKKKRKKKGSKRKERRPN